MGRKRRPTGWIKCPKKRRSAIGKREPTIFKKGMELYENCGVTVTLVTEKNGEYHFYHTGDGSIAEVLARYLGVAEDSPEAFSRRDAKLKAESEALGEGVGAGQEDQGGLAQHGGENCDSSALDDLGEWEVVSDESNWKQPPPASGLLKPSSSRHRPKTPTSVLAAPAGSGLPTETLPLQTIALQTNGTHPPPKKAPRKRNRSNQPSRSHKSKKKTATSAADVVGGFRVSVENEDNPPAHIDIPLRPDAQGCAGGSDRKRSRPEEIHRDGVLCTDVGQKKKKPGAEPNIQVDDWLTAVESMMQLSKTGEASVATTADDPIFAKFAK